MHSLNLGVYHVCNAEGILAMARSMQDMSLNDALDESYKLFRAWLHEVKVPCSQRKWTASMLHLGGEVDNYPWLKTKAYNSRVILGWLAVSRLRSDQTKLLILKLASLARPA